MTSRLAWKIDKKWVKFIGGLALLTYAIQSRAQISYFDGYGYEFVSAPGISWVDAETGAEAAGGTLPVILGAAQNSFIASIVPENSVSDDQVWLGGFQVPITNPDPAGGWTWIGDTLFYDDGPVGGLYSNWQLGEPNDAGGSASEQYLDMEGSSGYWNDEGFFDHIEGYVIETSAAPEPSIYGYLATLAALSLTLINRGKSQKS